MTAPSRGVSFKFFDADVPCLKRHSHQQQGRRISLSHNDQHLCATSTTSMGLKQGLSGKEMVGLSLWRPSPDIALDLPSDKNTLSSMEGFASSFS